MALKPLLLPITIRTPTEEELPKEEKILERLRLSKEAILVNGFSFTDTSEKMLQYNFFSEINVDNSHLWALIRRLLMEFPDYVCLIFNHIDANPSYSQYTDKFVLLNKVDKYEKELSMDGYLEFGFIFQDEEVLVELFVKKAKYIQFWGRDEVAFRATMQEFDLTEVPNINFIDEYPLVTEALRLHHPELVETTELLETLSRL